MADNPKRSFMSRLRKSKADVDSVEEDSVEQSSRQGLQPDEVPKSNVSSRRLASVTREGVPVISATSGDTFHISDVRGVEPKISKSTKNGLNVFRRVKKETVVLKEAPTAKESAFSGPPRYDWIDIETAAAIKLQSVFRRNKAVAELESKGLSTSAMRNRKRRRRARNRNVATTEDAPGLLQCCGLGLIFGDASEDDAANRAYSKTQYEERRKLREEDEARKRQYKTVAKNDRVLCEAVETVF